MALLVIECPSFVAKDEIRHVLGVGKIAECIQSIFLKRGDTKERRAEALKQIQERQVGAEKGLFPHITIFPEGCTTNGEGMIQFKKGSFASLRPVRPVVFKYWTASSIKATQDVAGFFSHILITIGCIAITMKLHQLPVFDPNEYFWEHHWQKDKEEKWEAYARVIRDIMALVGNYKISNLTMQDKFDYQKHLDELLKPRIQNDDQFQSTI